MTVEIDGYSNTAGISIFSTSCLETFQFYEKKPHQYHREYIEYIKLVDVSKIIEYYNFTLV